jgi:hypothetical protein
VAAIANAVFAEEHRPYNFCAPWLSNTRELFLLCFELFVTGVSRRHCNGVAGIALHEISHAQFMDVGNCMFAAGIDCNLRVIAGHCPGAAASLNLADILAMPPDLDLGAYVLVATSRGVRYELTFAVIRNPGFPCCGRPPPGRPWF